MEWNLGQWFKMPLNGYRQCVRPVYRSDSAQLVCDPSDGYLVTWNCWHERLGIPCDPPEIFKKLPVAGSIVETEDGMRWLIQNKGEIWHAAGPGVWIGTVEMNKLLDQLPGWRIVGHIDELGE